MKKIVFIFLLIIISACLPAQQDEKQLITRPLRNVNLTIYGGASLITLNFEKLKPIKSSVFITPGIGIGITLKVEDLFEIESLPSIPAKVTCNLGSGRHFFEAGLGLNIVLGDIDDNFILYPVIGYRIQPLREKKIYFRLYGCIPFSEFSNIGNKEFLDRDIAIMPFGLSIGMSF